MSKAMMCAWGYKSVMYSAHIPVPHPMSRMRSGPIDGGLIAATCKEFSEAE